MKLKQQPADFQVEELTAVTPVADGPYAFYQLNKHGWSSLDAFQAIRRRWQLTPQRLSYGGLKDKHAHTVQYFSIHHGPRRGLRQTGIDVRYLGQLAEPYTSAQMAGNRFRLTLRAVTDAEWACVRPRLLAVARWGVPNYFDDQRFGSVMAEGAFMAKAWVLGDYEEALRRALTAPYKHDRPPQKKEKAILKAHWGDWRQCKAELPRGHARSLVTYLVDHPTNFRGALARLRGDLASLYLAAYQSYLWNRLLAEWLRRQLPADQLIPLPLRLDVVPIYRHLDDEQGARLAEQRLPLPTARCRLPDDDPLLPLVRHVLAAEGIELSQLKIKGERQPFFARGDRTVMCLPRDLSHQLDADERHPGKHKLILSFTLPPGSYATLIVKAIFAPGVSHTARGED
ncbi:MAG: tRNA pseudouridine(13) synthase TruD [Gemmataceae bacterium]